jgi:hypothetical protein
LHNLATVKTGAGDRSEFFSITRKRRKQLGEGRHGQVYYGQIAQ